MIGSFIFGSVVGHWKEQTDNVLELLAGQGCEVETSSCAVDAKGAVEAEHPVLRRFFWYWGLDVGLLGEEICKGLRLDSLAALEGDVVGSNLHGPLDDATSGILVAENITNGVLGYNSDLEPLEVMAKLLSGDEDSV